MFQLIGVIIQKEMPENSRNGYYNNGNVRDKIMMVMNMLLLKIVWFG